MAADAPTKVLVVGGGVAALETVLALQSLGPGRFDIELLAPERHFTYRPHAPGATFRRAPPSRIELAAMARERGFRVIRDALDAVDAAGHRVLTQDGASLSYDVLVLAIGTRPVTAVDGAMPFRGTQDVAGVADALEALGAGSLAYVARSAAMWTLPLYELALDTAAWAKDRQIAVEVVLATAERAPLEVFGTDASGRVAGLLERAGIRLMTGIVVDRVQDGALHTEHGERIPVDLAVALPYVIGSSVPGLPQDRHGFTPVEDAGEVRGLEDVYAVGGMTDRPLTRGGAGAHQADVAASAIAAAAAVPILVAPYRPVLHGVLPEDEAPLYLRHPPEHDWSMPADAGIGAVHLSPYVTLRRALDARR
jgi:sulfide:quinone oxidoreductase